MFVFIQSFRNAAWNNYFCYSGPLGTNHICHGWHLEQILADVGWQTHFRVFSKDLLHYLSIGLNLTIVSHLKNWRRVFSSGSKHVRRVVVQRQRVKHGLWSAT